MSQEPDGKTPRDVANEAEGHVVHLPRLAFSHMLQCTLSHLQAAEAQGTSANRDADSARIKDALDYLKAGFLTKYAHVAGSVPEPLETAVASLLKTLENLDRALPAVGDEVEVEVFQNLGQDIEHALAPAVATFLGALFDSVVAHEKASAKLAKDVDSSALSQIDALARKINFIAVNASVEAARVGDQGRGFAVIASEIKDLSQQSRAAVEQMRNATV